MEHFKLTDKERETLNALAGSPVPLFDMLNARERRVFYQQELLGENGEFGLIVDNNGTSLYEGLKTLLSSNTCLMHYKQKSQEKGRQFALKNLEQKVYEKL